jgi:hypothetical protein
MNPQPPKNRAPRLLVTFSLGLALCGCAGYRLGPTQGRISGAQSVQVTPFHNRTLEPRLSEPVTVSLRRQIQRDGTFRLDTRDGDADVILTGTLVEYDRQAVAFLSDDTRTARQYQITVLAEVKARERGSGRVLFDRLVRGHSTVWVGDDLVSAERQGMPLVAEDLARNVTALLADGDW